MLHIMFVIFMVEVCSFFIFSRDVFRFSPQITERLEEGTLFGAKYVSPSGQENIKILVSKNFFQTKFKKIEFFFII